MIFGYLTFNYLNIIPENIFTISIYIFIYYLVGVLLAISISLIIVGILV